MIFTSPLFLFGFLPLFVAVYFASPRRMRNIVILVFSLFFYSWGEPRFVFIVFLSSLFDWLLGKVIWTHPDRRVRKRMMIVGVLGNVLLLAYFKYFNFFASTINDLSQAVGGTRWSFVAIFLPMAISFIAFEKITYIVDIYRRVAEPAESFHRYLVYVFFFPKMMAGPIIKYHDIRQQLENRQETFTGFHHGLIRIVQGLAKKVLIAHSLGFVVDQTFAMPAEQLTAGQAWLGAFAFYLELFFDFSGYTDMALGMAEIMGIRLVENFNQHYRAESFTDFWKRWHISLTQWIREYLYVPLGGNRQLRRRIYLNLWICFVISGLWHGANWTFVVWGIYNGFMLIAERLGWLGFKDHLPHFANVTLTAALICLGLVLFRSPDLNYSGQYFQAMVSVQRPSEFIVDFDPHLICVFLIASSIYFYGMFPQIGNWCQTVSQWRVYPYLQTAAVSLLLLLVLGELSASQIKTFLYYRF